MAIYHNILAVIDPTQNEQPALYRAIFMARKNSASIKAFLSTYDLSYEITTLLSPDERQAMRKSVIAERVSWIHNQCQDYLNEGISIEIKVVWHNRPFEAIIHEVLLYKHDIVLKMAKQKERFESLIFTPTDWHLLRKCPCPVWMLKDKPWPNQGSRLLIAVNLTDEEPYHLILNKKLLNEALDLVQQVNGVEIHLVGAYPATPINIPIELPDFNSNEYNDNIRQKHVRAMQFLCQQFSIMESHSHIIKGVPEEVIPELAEKIQANIVILGTVGRTGISAAFIGNTAEHVINHLTCDLLAIKPDGYVSPIELPIATEAMLE